MMDIVIKRAAPAEFRLREFLGSETKDTQFTPSAWHRLFRRERPTASEIFADAGRPLDLPVWQNANVYVMQLKSLTSPASAMEIARGCINGVSDMCTTDRYLHPWVICQVLQKIGQIPPSQIRSQYFLYGRDVQMVPAVAYIAADKTPVTKWKVEVRWTVSVYDPHALSIPARSGLVVPRSCNVD